MWHELAADEWNEKQRSREDQCGDDHGGFWMVKAPRELAHVFLFYPFERLVPNFSHTLLEPVRAHYRHECEREDQSANQGDRHRVRHRMKKFSGRPCERVDRNVSGDNY